MAVVSAATVKSMSPEARARAARQIDEDIEGITAAVETSGLEPNQRMGALFKISELRQSRIIYESAGDDDVTVLQARCNDLADAVGVRDREIARLGERVADLEATNAGLRAMFDREEGEND